VGAPPPPAAAQPREWPVQLVTLSGQSEVFRKAAGRWEPAALRAELGEGDGVRTWPGAHATLKTGNGHSIRIAGASQVFLLTDDTAGAAAPRVRMDRGAVWIAVAGVNVKPQLEVWAGLVAAGVRGGGVEVRGTADGSVMVRVHHGTAECKGPPERHEWTRPVSAGQELVVPAQGSPQAPRALTQDPVDSGWVKWNAEQDAAGGYRAGP
jgi:hypothetical protein